MSKDLTRALVDIDGTTYDKTPTRELDTGLELVAADEHVDGRPCVVLLRGRLHLQQSQLPVDRRRADVVAELIGNQTDVPNLLGKVVASQTNKLGTSCVKHSAFSECSNGSTSTVVETVPECEQNLLSPYGVWHETRQLIFEFVWVCRRDVPDVSKDGADSIRSRGGDYVVQLSSSVELAPALNDKTALKEQFSSPCEILRRIDATGCSVPMGLVSIDGYRS